MSDTGLVRNDNTGRILKPFASGYENAYLAVDLWNGRRKRFKVHRLVALAFIPRGYGPNASRRNEVNHLDLNTHNNNVNNLQWCDRCENEKHKREAIKFEEFMHAHEDILLGDDDEEA